MPPCFFFFFFFFFVFFLQRGATFVTVCLPPRKITPLHALPFGGEIIKRTELVTADFLNI